MLGSTLHGPYSCKALSLPLYLPLKDLNAPKNNKSTLHKILESSYKLYWILSVVAQVVAKAIFFNNFLRCVAAVVIYTYIIVESFFNLPT
jgi:hypothetical protein